MDNVPLKESFPLSNRNMCRLCLSSNGVTEPIGYDDQYLIQKIYECTSVQISPLAGVPSVLCTICRARLEDFYQFRWHCIKNDEIIRRIAASSNNKPALVGTTESDKRMQGSVAVYSTNPAGMDCMERHSTDVKAQPHHTQLGMTIAEGYASYGSKYSEAVPVNPPLTETSTFNVRRKRGRPPKQQYEFGTHLIAKGHPANVVGEHPDSMQRFSDGRWNSASRTTGSMAHIEPEPSGGSSSENQEGQEWFKIKLEQTDQQQVHPVHNDLPMEPRNHQYNTGSSPEESLLGHVLGSPVDAQIQPHVTPPPSVKRSRGRPPREGGCPNEDREEYRFRCQYCSARFKAAINLKLHTNTHTGEKPYLCTICNKSFAHPSNLSVHMKLHSNQLPSGAVGGNGASYRGSLRENGQEAVGRSPQPEKKFQCPYCRTLFALAFQLKIHINTHTGQKPYVCKSCGKGFAQPSNLHVHSKKHCRRKQSQLFIGETSTAEQPSGVGHFAQPNASETHGVTPAFERVPSFPTPDHALLAPMSMNAAARSTHHPATVNESQRINHPAAMNVNHAMLV